MLEQLDRAQPPDPLPAPLPAVSIVIGTRNRGPSLRRSVETVVRGSTEVPFEILIVDNGSTDDTARLVHEMAAEGLPVRYAFELAPGVAFARNRGILQARAPIVAFMDDDQQADREWVPVIARTLEANPRLHFLAGRVLPPPGADLPDWVTPLTRGALSIIDRGDTPAPIDAEHWMCLPGGNSAYRRDVLLAVGGFRPYARSQDRELTVRLLQAGYVGRYIPAMLQYHEIDPSRVTREHFRRWMAVEGRTRARYRFDELFDRNGRILPAPLQARKLFGVSAFVYRELLTEAGRWALAALRGRATEAFGHELRARYLSHYVAGAARDVESSAGVGVRPR